MLNVLFVVEDKANLFNVDAMIAQVTTDPFGDGLWITVMLLSTLIPTGIHALAAITSLFALRGKREERKAWLRKMDAVENGDRKTIDSLTRGKIARYLILRHWIPGTVATVGALALVAWGLSALALPEQLLHVVEWAREVGASIAA